MNVQRRRPAQVFVPGPQRSPLPQGRQPQQQPQQVRAPSGSPSSIAPYVAQDRITEALARLSLHAARGQFPAEIQLAGPQDSATTGQSTLIGSAISNALPSSQSALSSVAISDLVTQRAAEAVRGLTRERYIPYFTRSPDIAVEQQPQERGDYATAGSKPNAIVDIARSISSGTAQGTVYAVSLNTDAASAAANSDGKRDGDGDATPTFHLTRQTGDQVKAIMKKSPIYEVTDWQRYTLARGVAWAAANGSMASVQRVLASPDVQQTLRTLGIDLQRILQDPSTAERTYRRVLKSQYVDNNNDAYVDAIGYVMCGTLADVSVSPFFTLAYGCYRAYDTQYFSGESVATFSELINSGFPVQLTFIQPLGGDVYKLANGGWFGELPSSGFGDRGLNSMHTMAFFAQVVFGLGVFQAVLGGVHNDLHIGNLLHEAVDSSVVLYYVDYADESNVKYYAVPTYGVVVKIIDFGRSTFEIYGETFGSKTSQLIDPTWNPRDDGADLLRALSVWVYAVRCADFILDETRAQSTADRSLVTFCQNVLQCADNQTLLDFVNQCQRPAVAAQVVAAGGVAIEGESNPANACQQNRLYQPFLGGISCIGGVPQDNYRYFDLFRVSASSIPANAILYPVLKKQFSFTPMKTEPRTPA